MTRFGNDCRDGFALIANFIYSKCIILDFLSRPRSDFRKRMRYGGKFRTCQRTDNTGCRGRLRYIDSRDPSMGIGRSHKLEIQHSLQLVVISEDALSLNEAGIFQTRQPSPLPVYAARVGGVASAKTILILASPRICEMPRLKVTVKWSAASFASALKSGRMGQKRSGSVKKV